MVAGGQLLEALDVRGQPVRCLHELVVLAIALPGRRRARGSPLAARAAPCRAASGCDGLDGLVGRPDVRVEVLDRRREIARQHLAGVVEQGQDGRALGIRAALEQPVADHPQGVRDHRHAQAVLLDVLRIRVVHQAPPPNELHAGQICKEVTHRAVPPAGLYPVSRRLKPSLRRSQRDKAGRAPPLESS